MAPSARPTPPSSRGGIVAVLYGVVAYFLFLGSFLYAIGFVGNFGVPKSIDSGDAAPLLETLNVNLALLAIFALQHGVMARPEFKRWWTTSAPTSIERSTVVLAASLSLWLLYWQWRPIPTIVWRFGEGPAQTALEALFWLGWGTALANAFLINRFELGPLFFRHVRNPIYLGFLVAFWATPTMTVGHLMFAVGTTGYILLGIYLEERDPIDAGSCHWGSTTACPHASRGGERLPLRVSVGVCEHPERLE